MTADSPFHSARLASASPAESAARRRRRARGQGLLSLLVLLLGAAVLLSLAVMFLPLSHPHTAPAFRHGYLTPHLHPSLIPSLG
jgi:hypothetical protein